jgi:TetR/AcrR family transcriptional regulator
MKNVPSANRKSAARNPRESQERILDAALKEFAAKGFAGARVDAIARAARINKRMLYHYFGDKEVLFREVIRRKMEKRAAWVASAPEDPTENLPHWFQLACSDPNWVRLLEWEALQWGEGKVIAEEHRREAYASALEHVKDLQSRGVLAADLDAGQLLLSMIALTTYPLAFPQVVRLATGLAPSDPEFKSRREQFLRRFGAAFKPRKQFKK